MNRIILAESKNYRLEYEWELPVLIDKLNEVEYQLREHYGDPCCAIIDEKYRLCLVGGEGLSVFFIKSSRELNFLDNLNVHAMKHVADDLINILIDPWCNNHGVWQLDIHSMEIRKISEGPDLREFPFQETVEF